MSETEVEYFEKVFDILKLSEKNKEDVYNLFGQMFDKDVGVHIFSSFISREILNGNFESVTK